MEASETSRGWLSWANEIIWSPSRSMTVLNPPNPPRRGSFFPFLRQKEVAGKYKDEHKDLRPTTEAHSSKSRNPPQESEVSPRLPTTSAESNESTKSTAQGIDVYNHIPCASGCESQCASGSTAEVTEKMLLRSRTRACSCSSSGEVEAERLLQGDLPLVWTFLQEEGWCFARNSWDVCPPAMNKDPGVLGEGFEGRAFSQAQLPSYLVKHPELLTRYHQWRERVCRDGEGEQLVKSGNGQPRSNRGRASQNPTTQSYSLRRSARRVSTASSRTVTTPLLPESPSAVLDDRRQRQQQKRQRWQQPKRQEQQSKRQEQQSKRHEQQQQRRLRQQKLQQKRQEQRRLRHQKLQQKRQEQRHPQQQPSASGSKDLTAIDISLPDSSDTGEQWRGSEKPRSHGGPASKQSATSSCVFRRSARRASSPPSHSSTTPKLPQPPPAVLDDQQQKQQPSGAVSRDTHAGDVSLPDSSDMREQYRASDTPRSHRGRASKQSTTSSCVFQRSARRASSPLSRSTTTLDDQQQKQQPSGAVSRDTHAGDVSLPGSSDTGEQCHASETPRSHQGRASKQSATSSCVFQRSARRASPLSSRSTTMPQLPQPPRSVLDDQQEEYQLRTVGSGKKRKVQVVGIERVCASAGGAASATGVKGRVGGGRKVDELGSGGGGNEGGSCMYKRVKTEPEGPWSTSSWSFGAATTPAAAQAQAGGAEGDRSRVNPYQSRWTGPASDPPSTPEYASGRGVAGGGGGDGVDDLLAPYNRIAAETVDDSGLEKLLHTDQRSGYLDLRKYRKPGWPRPLRVTRLEASHGKRFEDHLLRLLKEKRRVEATVFLRRLVHFDRHPPQLAAAAMNAVGGTRESTTCIPAWYQEIAGVDGGVGEVVDVTANDMEVIECLDDEPLDSVEGPGRGWEHGGSDEGTSSGSVGTSPFIKTEI